MTKEVLEKKGWNSRIILERKAYFLYWFVIQALLIIIRPIEKFGNNKKKRIPNILFMFSGYILYYLIESLEQ